MDSKKRKEKYSETARPKENARNCKEKEIYAAKIII